MPQQPPATVRDRETRQDLRDYLASMRELGPGWEDAVAASFLTRVERRLDVMVEQRVQERLRSARVRRGSLARLALCLTLAIPLSAIAGEFAGLDGILVVWGAILLLNWDFFIPS